MLDYFNYTIKDVDSHIGGAIVGNKGGTIKTISKQNNSNIVLKKVPNKKIDIEIKSDTLVNILNTVITIKKLLILYLTDE